jgi:hypothetical protein
MQTMNQSRAEEMARSKNQAYHRAGNFKSLAVVVEGPEVWQATVMDVKEAIEHGFPYSWSI